jgi:hypothetical protein
MKRVKIDFTGCDEEEDEENSQDDFHTEIVVLPFHMRIHSELGGSVWIGWGKRRTATHFNFSACATPHVNATCQTKKGANGSSLGFLYWVFL